MARTARGFHQGRPSSLRRRTGWEEGPGGTTATSFTDTIATILGAGFEFLLDGLTIVRIRGSVQAFLTVGGTNSGFHAAIGMGIVSADAFAVGVTAVPNPIDDADWNGWMYHRYFDLHGATTFNPADQSNSLTFEVDSKAMRKVGVNEVLFASIETVESGTATMSVFFESRILLKLP